MAGKTVEIVNYNFYIVIDEIVRGKQPPNVRVERTARLGIFALLDETNGELRAHEGVLFLMDGPLEVQSPLRWRLFKMPFSEDEEHEIWWTRDERPIMVSKMPNEHLESCWGYCEQRLIKAATLKSKKRRARNEKRFGEWQRRFQLEMDRRAGK